MQRIVPTLLAALLTCTAAQAAQLYKVTDLGAITGSNHIGAVAVDDQGEVVINSGGHVFYWTQSGGAQDLGLGTGYDVNSGKLVGQTAANRAFAWTSSSVGLPTIDGTNSGADVSVNSSGVSVGYRVNTQHRPIQWSSANSPSIISNADATASGINDGGQRIGNASGVGFYNDGTNTILGAIPLIPNVINNNKFIGGSASGVAATYDVNTISFNSIGKLHPTDASSSILGLNNSGTAVGFSGNSAIIWTQLSGLLDLTTQLRPFDSAWSITSANDINSSGNIAATGLLGGVQHAVLLTPVPEPSAIALAGLGGAGLVLAVARRRCAKRSY